jgi:hypothetical protein
MLKSIGAFLIFLCLALPILAREWSPEFQNCIATDTASEAGQQKEESATSRLVLFVARIFALRCTGAFFAENGEAITALSTIVIAIFTVILGIATYILSDETRRLRSLAVEERASTMEALLVAGENAAAAEQAADAASDQAKIARDSLIASNRAWVFAQPWPRAMEFNANGDITIYEMELRLYGNSPATVMELYVDFTDEEPSGEEATYPKEPIRHTYGLAPGNQWFHRETFTTTNARPYIFGFVRYIDQFGCRRESRYCYRLVQGGGNIRTAGSAAWSRFT